MAATSLLTRRFTELAAQLDEVEATKSRRHGAILEGDSVESGLFLYWRVKVRDLISKVCGKESEYYKEFEKQEKGHIVTTSHEKFLNLKQVFLAVKDDYEKSYLNSIRNLVQAEVFDNELEQATELLKSGYKESAAVVAGVVLETTLSQMCTDRNITLGKASKMNDDLTKAGAYNSLTQKRITALLAVRNAAAHVKKNKLDKDEFDENNVIDMISQVRDFVERSSVS